MSKYGGHITLAQTDDHSVRVGHIVIEYDDAIGNRYKTEVDLGRPDGREYETYLWRVGGWQQLRAQSGE